MVRPTVCEGSEIKLPIIEIDEGSGFCFGVVNAIRKAEEELSGEETLYCLGDIVHNGREVARLEKKGLVTFDHEKFAGLHRAKVLLRAHGEPPETYGTARRNHITLIDATCPVVLQLQRKIKQYYLTDNQSHRQIVIYGKIGHAEVNGLVGQTEGRAIVLETTDDLHKLDFSKPIRLYAQTTKSVQGFKELVAAIEERMEPNVSFEYFDTICRQVANRLPNIGKFAARHKVVLFVSGLKSSNGKVLFEECRHSNPNTHLITNAEEVQKEWFDGVPSIGICGATSTPKWLMEEVQRAVETMLHTKE